MNDGFVGMKRTAIVWSESVQVHKHTSAHPERPSRLSAIMQQLTESKLAADCEVIHCNRRASDEGILLVYEESYLDRLKRIN